MDNGNISTFGRNLKAERQAQGLSQYALSVKAHLPQHYISRLETGRQQDVLLVNGYALAQALGCTVEYMLKEKEDC